MSVAQGETERGLVIDQSDSEMEAFFEAHRSRVLAISGKDTRRETAGARRVRQDSAVEPGHAASWYSYGDVGRQNRFEPYGGAKRLAEDGLAGR